MKKKYKKGDALILKYRKKNYKDVMEVIGVVLNVSDIEITLGHNFSGTNQIDSTIVPLSNILDVKKITPEEINSINDLKM